MDGVKGGGGRKEGWGVMEGDGGERRGEGWRKGEKGGGMEGAWSGVE